MSFVNKSITNVDGQVVVFKIFFFFSHEPSQSTVCAS
uniref:Uncharacterized protein n=1 Tax=Anguilla anguilla TaxID=7936 RepID=A0A0E9RKE7_ANGAN